MSRHRREARVLDDLPNYRLKAALDLARQIRVNGGSITFDAGDDVCRTAADLNDCRITETHIEYGSSTCHIRLSRRGVA